MHLDKSVLRLRYIKKRKKLYPKHASFPFGKIFSLIKKNFSKKKILVGCYFPSNFEVNILNFLYLANKKKFTVGLPIIKKNYKRLKLFGVVDLKEKFDVEVNFITNSAKEKIEKLGGKVSLIK